MTKFELNENEQNLVCDLLGYLNFSSGSLDERFVAAWNGLYKALAERGSTEIWQDAFQLLRDELPNLEKTKDAFRDSRQARRILSTVEEVLTAYREFHEETLFHQKNSFLFNPFFLARICRLTVARDVFGDEKTLVSDVVRQANDFLGYRPIPVLEGEEKHEPAPQEWIALLPLYVEGVGVAVGPYSELIERTLKILRETPTDILREASFDPDNLRELALDPRAFDFDHPVNRRPNYLFGTWDDRLIDGDGYFRRFVLQQTTLDAISSRLVEPEAVADPTRRAEYLYEAAAVLAGTILMASAVSGGRVQAHDSTVSLPDLLQTIAAFRDEFYERLIERVEGPHRARLTAEAARLFQPFAGARQFLNRSLAKRRADQTQRFSLARTYARMGYFAASKRQAAIIETPSSRILSRIDSLITEAHLAADAGEIEKGAALTPEIESLLHRGVACGAFPDPWFIIGFGGQFSLFQSADSVVQDHRLDGLVDLLNDIFDLYGRLQKEAASRGLDDLRVDLSDQMSELAGWWDQFGSDEISNFEGFSGQEVWESAAQASTALAACRKAGGAIGDVAFWRRHVERFKSPKAFVLLGEALLDKGDLTSAASLLIYWLDRSATIPLTEGDYSFNSVAFSWLETVWSERSAATATDRRKRFDDPSELTKAEYLERWTLTKTFLDRLEANAGDYWFVPRVELDPDLFDRKLEFKTDNPILADLARRLILSTKLSGRTEHGAPRLSIKASFKDVVRSLSLETLPTAAEFDRFYRDNESVFPPYITFRVFMQVVLNELRLTPEARRQYGETAFGNDRSVSVSNPKYDANPNDRRAQKAKLDAELERRQAELWKKLADVLDENDEQKEVNSLIEQILDEYADLRDDDALRNLGAATYYEDDDEFETEAATRPEEPRDAKKSEKKRDSNENARRGAESDYDDFSELNGDGGFGSYSDGEFGDAFGEFGGGFDDEDDDPLYGAAYDGVTFRDSADDGVDDSLADGQGGPTFGDEGDEYEFAKETDRVNERLSFIFSTAKFWKFAAGKSPLLRAGAKFATPDAEGGENENSVDSDAAALDDETLRDARLRLENWLAQAIVFERDLYELLDQTSRYRVPKPFGTVESLAEYDQLRGTKEILLDRVIWTIVELEDAILFLKATLRDESVDRFEKPWRSVALQTLAAIFRVDVRRVRRLWPELIRRLGTETLLYIPTSRGGDAKAIVDVRRLQQATSRLLEYAPRLGLLSETFRLLHCAQKMEQIRLSAPGSITEFDRFVGIATRGVTETLAESSKSWRLRPDDRRFSTNDEALVYYLEKAMDQVLATWLSHSQHIRISSIEAIATESQWKTLKTFIQRYGADLFTQHFLSFRNVRAILQQGVHLYLATLVERYREDEELEFGEKLVSHIAEGKEDFDEATALLGIALEAVAENYSHYVDYNSTTTQSDRGENLYMFIDFLRVLARYERISWNLKPVYWVHDALIRAGKTNAAVLWKRNVKMKSSGLSQESLDKYRRLNEQYGVWLATVYERIEERFVRPLDVAQMCGLVFDAISEARRVGEENPVFAELEKQIEEFANVPTGGGFELPDWLNALQEEVVESRVDAKEEFRKMSPQNDAYDPEPVFPIEKLSRAEVERQLSLEIINKNN